MALSQQLDLIKALEARELGTERVLDHSSEYRDAIKSALWYLAESGEEFTADKIREVIGDPPRGVSTNLVGALFNAAAKAGLIRQVGYGISARVEGHGNLTRRWVGEKGGR